MAVQQNKKSPSRRNIRRSTKALASPTLSTDKHSGDLHRRHHIGETGYYRGRQIVEPRAERKAPDAQDAAEE